MAKSSFGRRLVRVVLVLLGCLTIAVAVVAGIAGYLADLTTGTFRATAPSHGGFPAEFDKEFTPVMVLPGFEPRAITEFPVKPAAEVGETVHADELVIGVEVGGEARAYPVNMLTGPDREILNDTLGGRHVAATW